MYMCMKPNHRVASQSSEHLHTNTLAIATYTLTVYISEAMSTHYHSGLARHTALH